MAGVPVKFRCYRCNQLLGVSRGKIGAIVACPKCSAELVVPEPMDAAPASASTDEPASPGSEPNSTETSFHGRPPGMDVGLALDFLDIRPEDIRVEPGASFPSESLSSEAEESVSDSEPPPVVEQPDVPVPTATVATAPPSVEMVMTPTTAPAPAATVPVPPIQLDAPSRRPGRRPQPQPVSVRARDLVLPRSVVASWSLFVILALAFAFLAGLLAGHYVWRVH